MEEIKKEELDKLMKIEGEIKGVVFQVDAKYILEKEGEEGLKKLEKRVKELGYPIDYRTVGALDFHPIGLRAISLLLIKDTFGWGDKEIREMGRTAPMASFIMKLLLKFFVTWKKSIGEIPGYWAKHYTIGSLEVVKEDEKTKDVILHLKDIKIHPILCLYLEGYFEKTYEFVIGKGRGKVEETKCMFKGDPYHEYVLTIKRE
jgi:hypothetical protein